PPPPRGPQWTENWWAENRWAENGWTGHWTQWTVDRGGRRWSYRRRREAGPSLSRASGRYVEEVLHHGGRGEVRSDQASPLPDPVGGAEVVQVGLDRLPLDQQHEARGRLDAPGHPDREAAGGAGQDGVGLPVGGGERVLLARGDVDE